MTVFVQTPIGPTLAIECTTLTELRARIADQIGVPEAIQLFHMGGRSVPENLEELCTLTLFFGCAGGKGGFGSLLRNQAQTRRKITNWDHSRDRDGRRIGNVKNENSLVDFFKKRREEESKIQKEVEQVYVFEPTGKVKAMQQTIKQAEVDIKLDQSYRNKLDAAERLIEHAMKSAAKKKAEKQVDKNNQMKKQILAELDEAILELD